MKRLLTLLVVVLSVLVCADVVNVPVSITKTTEQSVPVTIGMSNLLDLVGVDFDANWDSIRVINASEEELPYQIDDADLNGKLSSGDLMTFLADGPVTISVSDDFDVLAPEYNTEISVSSEDGEWIIESDLLEAVVNGKGFVRVTRFGDTEGTIVDEIGVARISGWIGSTYYINGELGNHAEMTTGDFRTKDVEVLAAGPVGVTVVSNLISDTFLGLEEHIITTIFVTGDIKTDIVFTFGTYADLMKLQPMVTRPMTDAAEDTVHMLPMFRRLAWADQTNTTSMEYWKDRNAVMLVNDTPYAVFPATDSMKPLWWGATYIFASEESWRSNYSPSLEIGVVEIVPEVPVVAADYTNWLNGRQWVYESREFRDGYFMWMPGEFQLYESTKGLGEDWNDFVMHFIAGDVEEFSRIYSLYGADSIEDAIDGIDLRTMEIQSIKIGE